ncbi:MAG TPA: carbohydrate-binding protein, partial [Saprospiraceae bacterium]|nr:carbohydrate-binding protein [Saprospiraceae bacterium]
GEGIAPEKVIVTFDYLADGFDKNIIAMGHKDADESTLYIKGKRLIEGSDCMSCHKKEAKSIGPSYRDIARKYRRQEAAEMAKYILNINQDKSKPSLEPSGTYAYKLPKDDKGKGVFIVRAAYTDTGMDNLPQLRSEESFVLRNSKLDAHSFDTYEKVTKMSFGGNNFAMPVHNGFMKLANIDLSSVSDIVLSVTAPKPQANCIGGKIEVRLDGPTGKILGEVSIEATNTMSFQPSKLKIPVTNANYGKMHDVYFVFSNPADESATLMIVMGVEFVLDLPDAPIEEVVKNQDNKSSFFVGKWNTTMKGTPNGDVKVVMTIANEGDQLTGSLTNNDGPDQPLPIDRLEKVDENTINIFFEVNGMKLNMNLIKKDENNLSGKLMGMLDVIAERVNN